MKDSTRRPNLTVAHDEITVTVQAPMRAGDFAAFSPAG